MSDPSQHTPDHDAWDAGGHCNELVMVGDSADVCGYVQPSAKPESEPLSLRDRREGAVYGALGGAMMGPGGKISYSKLIVDTLEERDLFERGRVQELQQDLERVSSNLVHSEHRFDPVMGLDEQGCALCGHPLDYPNHRAFERMGSALEGVRRVAERFLRDGGKVDPQSFLESLDEHLGAQERSPLGSEILLDWAKTLRSPKEDGEDQLGFTMRLVKAEHVSEAAQVLRRSRL